MDTAAAAAAAADDDDGEGDGCCLPLIHDNACLSLACDAGGGGSIREVSARALELAEDIETP
jgi:hypothetical protein